MNQKIYNSPIGKLVLTQTGNAISSLCLASSPVIETETPLLLEAVTQLEDYFFRQRKAFTLPLATEGTPFQRKVWNELLRIPYGETWSYKQLAESIGNSKACRAVGNANGKNPIMILIPCHRVIAANGTLGGFSGGGVPVKRQLLELETPHEKSRP